MKKLLLSLFCLSVIFASAQNSINITTQQYETLKQANQLDKTKQYNFTDLTIGKQLLKPSQKAISKSPSVICSCIVPLDSSFTLAMAPNDDGSSALISLPFNFNFYGTNYTSLFINNNGNISFATPYGTFSSSPFPDPSYLMIAPFWSDVDTRGHGAVYYKITPTAIIIKWDSVGYYSSMTDKLNTFQLIITDGTDPILPSGKNTAFCYGDMQWTTGAASSGIGGFGGIPATVGVNQGDGISYFQVGRFDNAGTAFDGPYGANDSVDWLDNQGMYFDVASVGNTPPVIINNNICDTIDVYTGDTTHTMLTYIDSVEFNIGVSTPEADQTINTVFSCTSHPANFSYILSKNTATYKEYACKFIVAGLPVGIYPINITATDNGVPEAITERTVYIRNNYDASLAVGISNIVQPSSISIYPNPANETIVVKHNFTSASILTLSNMLGQNVMTVQLTTQQQSVDISSLINGVYFATITSKEGKSKTIKIIKK
ncbi:MAG: T9SS type A sorting domain-containing protein [Bacteroidetes bacterium]|nr:T9SS type A sorting domain-containing protein [Bacteroidota bacterium]